MILPSTDELSRAITKRRRMFTLSRDIQLVGSRVKSDVRVEQAIPSLLAALPAFPSPFHINRKVVSYRRKPYGECPLIVEKKGFSAERPRRTTTILNVGLNMTLTGGGWFQHLSIRDQDACDYPSTSCYPYDYFGKRRVRSVERPKKSFATQSHQ